MTAEFMVIILLIFTGGASFCLAWWMKDGDRIRYPFKRYWTWAYFQAWWPISILISVLAFAAIFGAAGVHIFNEPGVMAMAIWLLVFTALGVPVLKSRNRWCFFLFTLFSCMPLLWIINAIYLWPRWKEQDRKVVFMKRVDPSEVIFHPAGRYDTDEIFPDDDIIDAEYEEVKQ